MALERVALPAGWSAQPDGLAQRVILITGATGGLGRATALACAAAGATVVLSGRKVRTLEKVYDAIIEAGGPQPAIFPINLAGALAADYERLAAALSDEFGRLDGLVHAAAHFDALTPLSMHSPEDWLLNIQVNLNAPFLLTRACMPLLGASADSAVVFVLDSPERLARAHWGGYGTSKAGLERLVSILDQETEDTALRTHAVLPAPMRTHLRQKAWPGEMPADVTSPENAAAAIVHLLGAAGAHARGKLLDLR